MELCKICVSSFLGFEGLGVVRVGTTNQHDFYYSHFHTETRQSFITGLFGKVVVSSASSGQNTVTQLHEVISKIILHDQEIFTIQKFEHDQEIFTIQKFERHTQ